MLKQIEKAFTEVDTKMFERQYLVAGEPKMQSRIADANFYFNREDL